MTYSTAGVFRFLVVLASFAALVLAPVLVVGGVVRGVNNSKVNATIETGGDDVPARLSVRCTSADCL